MTKKKKKRPRKSPEPEEPPELCKYNFFEDDDFSAALRARGLAPTKDNGTGAHGVWEFQAQITQLASLGMRVRRQWNCFDNQASDGDKCGYILITSNELADPLQWSRFLNNKLKDMQPLLDKAVAEGASCVEDCPDKAAWCEQLAAEIVLEANDGFEEGNNEDADDEKYDEDWLEHARAQAQEQFSRKGHDVAAMAEKPLTIYTWGRSLRNNQPSQSQKNFNASQLNGRGGGIDTKTFNGTDRRIQMRITRCTRNGGWPFWFAGVVSSVEANGYTSISVNCSKGRHRSAGGAILLKELVYHNATIIHLEKKKGWGEDQSRKYTDTFVSYRS